eukprot:TRINITY_DN7043_c0_g1_i2.p1 TRINITY_DN7043_c0_g1~~TRINITY_DN7043_c0_g1_i2.p1  ORF type:complete len:768 (-),score=132.62 TRINITY_DN7043_c0_g1_i2:49-2244(-)
MTAVGAIAAEAVSVAAAAAGPPSQLPRPGDVAAAAAPPSAGMAAATLEAALLQPSTAAESLRTPSAPWVMEQREERRVNGVIKWGPESSVPDVGGMGWRTKAGHLLKNQTYYSGTSKGENLWEKPTHAGSKTWQQWHGPRLRNDAQLIERLDRLDVDQAAWESHKAFVNQVRVQTLDRLNVRRIENEQRELASSWAPHRRARREMHSKYEKVGGDLDSLPKKDLKQVLTPTVLQGDRNAVREITKRIQVEETWKLAWKSIEQERHDEIRADFEHRCAYNDQLQELANQQPLPRQNGRRLPNNCTRRIEELALPRAEQLPGGGDVTKLGEFRGLIHVDHSVALEARFPGQGSKFAESFRDTANSVSKGGWPPPPVPKTPPPTSPKSPAAASSPLGASVEARPLPVPQARLEQVPIRHSPQELAGYAVDQLDESGSPPPRDQDKLLLQEAFSSDPSQIVGDSAPRAGHTSRKQILGSAYLALSGELAADPIGTCASQVDIAPPVKQYAYPVLVPTSRQGSRRGHSHPARPSGSANHRGRSSGSAAGSRRTSGSAGGGGAATAGSRFGGVPALNVVAASGRADMGRCGGPQSARITQGQRVSVIPPSNFPAASLESVCCDIDAFEAQARSVPRLGNFWKSLRIGDLPPEMTQPVACPDSDDEDRGAYVDVRSARAQMGDNESAVADLEVAPTFNSNIGSMPSPDGTASKATRPRDDIGGGSFGAPEDFQSADAS